MTFRPSYSHRYSRSSWMGVHTTGPDWTRNPRSTAISRGYPDRRGRSRISRWWAHQDSNLEPKDYEARRKLIIINNLAIPIFPLPPRGTPTAPEAETLFFRSREARSGPRRGPGCPRCIAPRSHEA